MGNRRAIVLLSVVLFAFIALSGWLFFSRIRFNQNQLLEGNTGISKIGSQDAPAGELAITESADMSKLPFAMGVLNGLMVKNVKLYNQQIQGENLKKMDIKLAFKRNGNEAKITVPVFKSTNVTDREKQTANVPLDKLVLSPGDYVNVILLYIPDNHGNSSDFQNYCYEQNIEGCVWAFKAGFKGDPVNLYSYLDQSLKKNKVINLDQEKFIMSDIIL